MAAKTKTEIPEAKIRQALWMQKTGKTKKAICEHLNIAYNTKRLDTILQDFKDKEARTAELKAQAKTKTFSEDEKKMIAQEYTKGKAISNIALEWYVSSPKIKKILIELNVPLRGRGKNSEAKTEHVQQDLDIKFKADDRVFVSSENCFGKILEVYDEEYIELLRNPIRRKIVYLGAYDTLLKQSEKTKEEIDEASLREGVHIEYYYEYNREDFVKLGISKPNFAPGEWKEHAAKHFIHRLETQIESTGREHYLVWLDTQYGGMSQIPRSKLFPVEYN